MPHLPLDVYPVKPPVLNNQIEHHPDYFDLNLGATIVHIGKSKSGKIKSNRTNYSTLRLTYIIN